MYKKEISKIVIISIVLSLSLNTLFAISPTSSVSGIGQDEDVGLSIYPVSSVLDYNVYNFPINDKYPLSFDVQIYGGYEVETIEQDPTTGIPDWSDAFPDSLATYDFGKIFTGGEFKFSQTLPISDDIVGKLSFWTSYTTRFERPVDLADYWSTDGTSLSIFRNADGSFNSVFTSSNELIGTPDLSGNRYLNSNAINAGLKYSHTLFELPYSISFNNYYAPQWFFNESNDTYGGTSDYFKSKTNFTISNVLLEKRYNDLLTQEDSRLLKLKLSNSLSYRYLNGDAVPMFIQDFDNIRHDINNTFKLSIYGPQIITSDTYPLISLYYYANYQWGALNNYNGVLNYPSEDSFSHKIYLNLDFRVIGIFHMKMENYYDIGENSFSIGTPYFTVTI
jgi:hypothetical protein